MKSKRHQYENALADSILEQIAQSEKTRALLNELAMTLAAHVLVPLEDFLKAGNFDVKQWPMHYQKTMINMMVQHSSTHKQYGSVLSSYEHDHTYNSIDDYQDQDEILDDPEKIRKLLRALRDAIENITQQESVLSVVKAIKVIIDMGYSYREYFPKTLKSNHYERIDSMLWPTPLEFLNRLTRADLGETEYFQNAPGIGHALGDGFIPRVYAQGRHTGGAHWGLVNMKASLKHKIHQYDALAYEPQNPLREGLAKELEALNIPLEKNMRRGVLSALFERWETSLEKISKQTGMPLIASVSGSTARVLTALFDAEAFTQDGMIDLENIQIFSNCVMGFFIRAGHHSFLEVAETYNRAIDFVVLEHADTLRDALDADVPEQYLPYFRYGNYRSFIHPRFDSMDEKIMREDDPIIPSYFFKHHDDEGSVETVARSLVATHHVTLF